MLKSENLIGYLTKEKISSEASEEVQHAKQITLRRKALRFKRSDDNPELPENFKVGQAIGGGDCFFDSVAQGLKQLEPEMDFTVKSLRKACKDLAVDNQQLKNKIIKDAKGLHDPTIVTPDNSVSDDELWNAYLASIEYTNDDINKMRDDNPSLYQSLTSLKYGSALQVPIWGRPDIEGRIICKEYNVKLYVAEKHVVEGKEQWISQIVNSEGSRSVDGIHYNEKNTIYIINRGSAHFEPVLRKQRTRSYSFGSDGEREKNTELFSAIRKGDLQKVQELLKVGVKVNTIDKNNKDNTPLHYAVERDKKEIVEELLQEWKADINVKNNRGDTPLHIATSKGNKELVQLLLNNQAEVNLRITMVRFH